MLSLRNFRSATERVFSLLGDKSKYCTFRKKKDLIKDNIVFTYMQIGDACASSLFAFC